MFQKCFWWDSRDESGWNRDSKRFGGSATIFGGTNSSQELGETAGNCWNPVGDHTWNAQGVCMSKALNAHLRCVEMHVRKIYFHSSSCASSSSFQAAVPLAVDPLLLSIRPSISMLLGLDPRSSWLSNGGLLRGLLPVPHRR